MKKFFSTFLKKLKKLLHWLVVQLKDGKNWVIFIIVCAVVSCEVWIPLILYFITRSGYWLGIYLAGQALWLGPFTPFLPLCLVITVGIRKLIDRKNYKNAKVMKISELADSLEDEMSSVDENKTENGGELLEETREIYSEKSEKDGNSAPDENVSRGD